VYPEYVRGSIIEQPLQDLVLSGEREWLDANKERQLPEYCRNCDQEFACFDECPKNPVIALSNRGSSPRSMSVVSLK
jgi:uncharacterized protein